MAEIQFAIKDARIAERIDASRTNRKQFVSEMTSVMKGMSVQKQTQERHKSFFVERVSIKVHGKIIQDECVIPMMLGMVGVKLPISPMSDLWTAVPFVIVDLGRQV
jgi:hypothetical protein